jgi:tRNA(fMet)-specific endonuclease VapC
VSGKYLLDTNIIISIFAKDPQIHNRLENAEEIFVPCIAIGELYFGAYKSIKVEENLARIDEFAINNTVLFCDADTAKRYGLI